MSVKINTDGIVNQTQTLMEHLDKMGNSTRKLYKTASDYNDRIQDGVMGNMVDLLDEIGRVIEEIKKRTYEFTKSKQEGAEMLGEIMKRNANKVNKI